MKHGKPRAAGSGLLGLALLAGALPACVQLGEAVSPMDEVFDAQRLRRVGLPPEVGGTLDLGGRRADAGVLAGRFEHAVYTHTDAQTATVVMWSGEAQSAEQAVVMRVLWTPRAGATPLDDFATNVTVRWAIFAGGEAGLYSGAGFAFPFTSVGGRRLSMKLEQSDLKLSEASTRFSKGVHPEVVKLRACWGSGRVHRPAGPRGDAGGAADAAPQAA